MAVFRRIVLAAALAALAMLAVSGPGTRLELFSWQAGFAWMKWAMFVGFGAALVAAVLLLIPRTRGPRPSLLIAALLVGLAAGAPLIAMTTQARKLPYIHDVTTDTRDPPAFVALLPARRAAPNGADYGGEPVAALQRAGYRRLGSLVVALPPPQAYERALRIARDMGWEIAAADAAARRIEATDTTVWFGFKDDVVIRIRPDAQGSRIDVRSMSRVGKSDVGANARRIYKFFDRYNAPGAS
jgi:hypothetical protein